MKEVVLQLLIWFIKNRKQKSNHHILLETESFLSTPICLPALAGVGSLLYHNPCAFQWISSRCSFHPQITLDDATFSSLLRLCVTYIIRKEKYKSVTGILDETIVKLFFCFPCFFFWTWMTPVWPSSLLWTSEPFHVLNQNKKDTTEYSCEMKCCMYKQRLTYSLGLKMS